ncbi:MAG: hypothetical protein ACI88H_000390 [Cocleimonas sp.]|jgi:hypothetical protein
MVFYFNKQSGDMFSLSSDYYNYDKYWKKIASFESPIMSQKSIKHVIQLIKDKHPVLIQPKYSDFEIDGIQLRQ